MKRAAIVAVVALLWPQTADAGTYVYPKITKLKVGSIAVSDQSCQHVPVTVVLSKPADEVDVGISYGGSPAGDLATFPQGTRADDYLVWCPDADLGHYRAGPSIIRTYDSLGSPMTPQKDRTRADFYVRRFSRLAWSQGVATLTAYSLTQRRFTGVRGVRVELRAAGGRVVDAGRTGAGGKVALRGSGARVVAVPTNTVAGAHHAA